MALRLLQKICSFKEEEMFKRVNHIGLAVKDIDQSTKLWTETFGVTAEPPVIEGNMKIVMLHVGDVLVELLGAIGDDSSREPLLQALKHAGPSAELYILMALAQLGVTEIIPQLAEKLDDPDPEVREAICEVVAYTVEGRDLEQVKKVYEAETDRRVKAALWEVLENIAVERKQEAAEGAS